MAQPISAEWIDSLVSNKVPESQRLEYKLELPKQSSSEKKEFLADVSAMANTAGGTILYGIDEERDANGQPTGLPASIPGVSVHNADQLRRGWEQMFGAALNPPLRGTTVQILDLGGRHVVALSIPRSLHAPHAVWFEGNGKFWRRRGSGKYQVEPAELKAMFLEQAAWEDEARIYHKERVGLIGDGFVLETSASAPGAIVIHLLPLGRLQQFVVPINDGLAVKVRSLWKHNHSSIFNHRPTIDGFIVHCDPVENWRLGFIHVLRFGGLEICIGNRNAPNDGFGVDHAADIVRTYVTIGTAYLQNDLNVDPPFAVAVRARNLSGMTGFYLDRYGMKNSASLTYRQGELRFPVMVTNNEGDAELAIKHLSDMFWNSAGFTAPETR